MRVRVCVVQCVCVCIRCVFVKFVNQATEVIIEVTYCTTLNAILYNYSFSAT